MQDCEPGFENGYAGLFCLQAREGVAACCMHTPKNTFEIFTIVLQQNQCILLGRNSTDIALSDVTFEGADALAAVSRRMCWSHADCVLYQFDGQQVLALHRPILKLGW